MKSEKLSSGLKSLKSLASMKNTITVLHHLLIISTCTGSNQGLEITALVFNTDRANMNTDKYLGIGRMYPVTSPPLALLSNENIHMVGIIIINQKPNKDTPVVAHSRRTFNICCLLISFLTAPVPELE